MNCHRIRCEIRCRTFYDMFNFYAKQPVQDLRGKLNCKKFISHSSIPLKTDSGLLSSIRFYMYIHVICFSHHVSFFSFHRPYRLNVTSYHPVLLLRYREHSKRPSCPDQNGLKKQRRPRLLDFGMYAGKGGMCVMHMRRVYRMNKVRCVEH